MYSVEGLENGIEQARKNIQTFEDAIQKERDTIDEYYRMIDVLKEKERAKKALEHVEESINADPSKLLQ
jgi:tetratricopeptide (TPR) repeat protein